MSPAIRSEGPLSIQRRMSDRGSRFNRNRAKILTRGIDGNSDPPEMENLPGAASHGRKLQNNKGQALEASIVLHCDK